METAKATVDYLRDVKGITAGCLTVFVFRPFPGTADRRGPEGLHGVHRLRTHGRSAVDDRQPPDPRDQGGVLRRRQRARTARTKIERVPRIYDCCRRPGQPRRPARRHHRRLPQHDQRRAGFLLRRHRPSAGPEARPKTPTCGPRGGFSMRGHSVGGFGSVTTNKVIATIAGNVFGKDVQAYPKYGSEKKGLPTTYYLTIADSHINMHCELEHVDLLCINDPTAILSPLTAQRPGARRRDLHAVAVHRPGRGVEAHSRVQPADHPRQEDPRLLLRHGQDRPRGGLGGRPADAHAGHRAAGGVPQADALRRARAR